jgi:hypothetical protein
MTMPDGGVLNARNILNTRRVSGTTVNARAFTVNDQLKSGIVNGGDVNIVAGRAGVIDVRESRDMIYGASGVDRTVTAPKLNIGTMNIANFGTCTNGCGQ